MSAVRTSLVLRNPPENGCQLLSSHVANEAIFGENLFLFFFFFNDYLSLCILLAEDVVRMLKK